jgi:hypothetical protein
MSARTRRQWVAIGGLLAVALAAVGGVVAVRRAKAFAIPLDDAGRPLPLVVITDRHQRDAREVLPWSHGPARKALDAFGAAYQGDDAAALRPGMMDYAVSRAEALGGKGESLRRALAAIEERRTPSDAEHLFDWLPCYAELVRHEGSDHWVIRVAWGDCSSSPERLNHMADYLVTAIEPPQIVSAESCA